ncbi:MAG TPA: hypothetical protein VJ281_04735 [Chthoniobacterales bacterium]|jgi:hypothetical protein|nr:hypothetical protein [Chthoniobacterales bacterium]
MITTNPALSHPKSGYIGLRAMKTTVLIAAIVLTAAAVLRAQVATNQSLRPASASPEPKMPERAQIDQIFKETSLGKEADERRLHIEWRQLQNQVINDRDIVAAKQAANTARTDFEKRERLRDYYNIYYDRMRVMARSSAMRTAIDQLKMQHIGQLTQARVRHETDSELPTPSPTPKKKKENRRTQKFRPEG